VLFAGDFGVLACAVFSSKAARQSSSLRRSRRGQPATGVRRPQTKASHAGSARQERAGASHQSLRCAMAARASSRQRQLERLAMGDDRFREREVGVEGGGARTRKIHARAACCRPALSSSRSRPLRRPLPVLRCIPRLAVWKVFLKRVRGIARTRVKAGGVQRGQAPWADRRAPSAAAAAAARRLSARGCRAAAPGQPLSFFAAAPAGGRSCRCLCRDAKRQRGRRL